MPKPGGLSPRILDVDTLITPTLKRRRTWACKSKIQGNQSAPWLKVTGGVPLLPFQNRRWIESPSGKPTSTILIGKTHYKWPFSMAMFNYQRLVSIGYLRVETCHQYPPPTSVKPCCWAVWHGHISTSWRDHPQQDKTHPAPQILHIGKRKCICPNITRP